MKVYKGFTASPGLVLGQVSRLDRPPLVFGEGPFHPEQEKQALEDAIKVAQQELDEMAGRAAPSEQAIFLFQSMMLEDEGFMNEVAFQIKAGVGAAEAMDRVGRRYAAQLAAMKDNAYMQLRSVDILDVTQRITNILCHRLRSWLALDHPVILASDLLMPTDLFSVPAGRILGLITAEGSGQSHAAIIARSLNIPGITQVGEDFLKDCDGREVILNATEGECILDPDAAFQIKAGVGAAEAMDRVGRRYAAQLAAMKDNAYMQLRSVDILDVTQRITNILCHRLRSWLALDHPVILASDLLMPTDLFSVPAGRILGLITAEGSGQSHAAIIARSLNIPGITQVGEDFLKDCDGREVILNATEGECILDPDAAARQSAITCICEMQRQNEELNAQLELPNRTRDGEEFELLANCFGPEDVGTAMESGASGVGLLRSSYMMMPGHAMDEQEQYLFYTSCLAAARGRMVTVRTFDFGADRTMADAYQGVQSSKLGLRGIRSSLRNLPQMAVQICALMRAATKGPLRVMFPMVTDVEDWDSAMQVVDYCRRKLTERGVEFEPDVPFGVMLSVPAACMTAEDFTAHGCRFFVIGTNDLTQYTHAVSRELAIAEHYYRPASPAMKKLIAMVVDAARKANIPVTICGLAVGNAVNATQYLRLGLRSFSMSPQNLLTIKKALRDADAE